MFKHDEFSYLQIFIFVTNLEKWEEKPSLHSLFDSGVDYNLNKYVTLVNVYPHTPPAMAQWYIQWSKSINKAQVYMPKPTFNTNHRGGEYT